MSAITDIAEEVKQLITDEWIKQGHDLTGAFVNGVTYKVVNSDGGVNIEFYDTTEQGYGAIIDRGVKPSDILYPYARKRIAGLTAYGKLRVGLTDKDAVSFAFAVATKHKREGMPLPSTARYSQTGKRTGFTTDATKNITDVIDKHMKQKLQETIAV